MKPAMTQGVLRPIFPAGIRPAIPSHLKNKTLADYVPSRMPFFALGKVAIFNFGGSAMCVAPSGLMAWIYRGSYRTQRHDNHFYDVAYVKPCTTKAGDPTGFMLDSECFDTEEQALLFVESLLLGQGGAA